jgi:transcription elongation GreA/GreB family factor
MIGLKRKIMKKGQAVLVSEFTKEILKKNLKELREKRRKIGEEGIPWHHEGPGVHVILQQTEAEISRIEGILNNCVVYSFPRNPEKIELGVGANLRVSSSVGEEEMRIGMVSSIDMSYLSPPSGLTLISPESPFGKELTEKKAGDRFSYKDPEGKTWKVVIEEVFSLSNFFKRG